MVDEGIELDVHAHLAPWHPSVELRASGVELRDGVLVVDGHTVALPDLYSPDRLVAWMDRHNVREALVSIPPPFYRQSLDAAEALEWAEHVNICLRTATNEEPFRLTPLFHLPVEHPQAAMETLEQLVTHARFKGVALSAGGHPDIDYASSSLDPMWQMLDAAQAFVFLHPGKCCDTRLSPFYLENLLGNPYETGLAAAQLVMAGVPARFRHVRFCLAHAGGVFPAVVGRLDRGFVTARPGLPAGVETPGEAARRFMADDIAHHPAMLELARDVFGRSNVVFGSDWPFPMGRPDGPGLGETSSEG